MLAKTWLSIFRLLLIFKPLFVFPLSLDNNYEVLPATANVIIVELKIEACWD